MRTNISRKRLRGWKTEDVGFIVEGARIVSKKLDRWLVEYCEDIVNTLHRSGYSGINIIEKILKDPGISTGGSRDRILWWPKNDRMAKMSKAFHQISGYSRLCLVVEYGRMVLPENGQILTKEMFCRKLGKSCAFFDVCVKQAKTKLRYILKTYEKSSKKNHCID